MKRKNRILGMKILLVLLILSLFLISNEITYRVGSLIMMFCAGYGLRETLDRSLEE